MQTHITHLTLSCRGFFRGSPTRCASSSAARKFAREKGRWRTARLSDERLPIAPWPSNEDACYRRYRLFRVLQNWCSTTAVLFRVIRDELLREARRESKLPRCIPIDWLVARRSFNVTRLNVAGPVLSLAGDLRVNHLSRSRVAFSTYTARFLAKRSEASA